jgi:hypothetical protein
MSPLLRHALEPFRRAFMAGQYLGQRHAEKLCDVILGRTP